MQTSLQGIAKKAAAKPKQRFQSLCSLLSEENLEWCMQFLNKKAAPGIDKVCYETYNENLDENIADLVGRLKRGTYKARLVRRKHIPKGHGKTRPLGIPILEDKLVQTAAAKILHAIFEPEFQRYEVSHGYRPQKSSLKAAKALRDGLFRGKYGYVVEADIKGYFDSIQHEWLVRMLEEKVDDQRFIRLIRKWLKANILEEDGKILNPTTGTPQGGIISAVLANIYLHYVLDVWFELSVKTECRGKATLMRYADDFVVCFQNKEDAEKFYSIIGERLEKFGLELAMEKTKLLRFSRFGGKDNDPFDFLGFEYRWDKSRRGKYYVGLRTSRKKLKNSVARFTEWIKIVRHKYKIGKILRLLRLKFKGYWNYYGVIGNSESLNEFYQQAIELLFKWLNRRSQRRSYTWEKFKELLKHIEDCRPRIVEMRTA